MRYIELKHEGKIHTDKWKIDEILIKNNFSWILNAEIENARLEITQDTLVWNAGIWYNGEWKFGVFRDGEWKYGTWKNGVWYNGKWKDGTFESGIIFNGVFVKGEIKGGQIRGGKFIDVQISTDVKEYTEVQAQEELLKSQIEPEVQPEVQPENKVKVQTPIQAQVQPPTQTQTQVQPTQTEEEIKSQKVEVSVHAAPLTKESIEFKSDELDKLKSDIKIYLTEKYPEDWWNEGFSNMVYDYISEDEVIGDGTEDEPEYESYEDAYQNYASGGAIEYDLLGEVSNDIIEKFDLTSEQFYDEYDFDAIVTNHMINMCDWWDRFVFGEKDENPFSHESDIDDLMSKLEKIGNYKKLNKLYEYRNDDFLASNYEEYFFKTDISDDELNLLMNIIQNRYTYLSDMLHRASKVKSRVSVPKYKFDIEQEKNKFKDKKIKKFIDEISTTFKIDEIIGIIQMISMANMQKKMAEQGKTQKEPKEKPEKKEKKEKKEMHRIIGGFAGKSRNINSYNKFIAKKKIGYKFSGEKDTEPIPIGKGSRKVGYKYESFLTFLKKNKIK